MNKDDLSKVVSEEIKITKQKASEVIDALFGAIVENLKQGDPVTLVGFGSFKTTQRAARTGRNPRTGESLSIAATTVPSFSAGKALKESVNQKK